MIDDELRKLREPLEDGDDYNAALAVGLLVLNIVAFLMGLAVGYAVFG